MSFSIDKALIKAFDDAAFGLPIADENRDYLPGNQEAYAELFVIQNDKIPQSIKELDQVTGIFRVILRYPLNVGSGTIKAMADTILAIFKIGSVHINSGLSTRVTKIGRDRGVPEDGWFKLVLTISFITFITR